MLREALSFLLLVCCGHAAKTKVPVTCGSAVTLQNKENSYFLHSHGIAWGSGSGQQSVTAVDAVSGIGNIWLVKNGSSTPEMYTVGR